MTSKIVLPFVELNYTLIYGVLQVCPLVTLLAEGQNFPPSLTPQAPATEVVSVELTASPKADLDSPLMQRV